MTLNHLSYETNFYWKGIRYTQVIRPKMPIGSYKIVCRPTRGQGKWVDMPSGRKVKPVLTLKEFNRQNVNGR